MQIKGGTLVALLGLVMLGVGFVGYLFYRHGGAFECVDRVVEELPSPDGVNVAARSERDCNGSIATHVLIHPRGQAGGDELYAAAGRPKVAVRWVSAKELAIDAQGSSALPAQPRWRDVQVRMHVTER